MAASKAGRLASTGINPAAPQGYSKLAALANDVPDGPAHQDKVNAVPRRGLPANAEMNTPGQQTVRWS